VRQPVQHAVERGVLGRGQVVVDPGGLPGVADHPADVPRLARHVEAADPGGPRGRLQQRDHDAHGGGLSRAVRPEQAEDHAGRDGERDPVDGRAAALVRLHQVLGLKG